MINIVADRTLPFPTTPLNSSTESTQLIYDPIDLSNIDTEANVVNETIQYHRCGGISHMARQCGTPNNPNRAAQIRSHQNSRGCDIWRRNPTMAKDHEKSTVQCRRNTTHDNRKKTSDIVRRDRRQINTVDDSKKMGTGSYYSGSWAEQSSSGDEPD